MEQATKKKLLIGGAVLVIAGIAGYFIFKAIKNRSKDMSGGHINRDKKTGNIIDATKDEDGNPLSTTGTGTTGGTKGGGEKYTFPFTTTDEGNKFRAWVIAKDPAFAKSISLDATGGLNSYLQKAWDKYGAAYNASLSASATASSKKFANTYDLLASDINGANGKDVYTTTIGLTVSNMNNQDGPTYPKNTLMGKVVSAQKGGNDYTVTFLDKDNGVKYYTLGKYTKIDVTPASSFDGMTVTYLGSSI